MRKIWLVTATMAAGAAQAQDLPQSHLNVIKHVAEASVIAEKCPVWKLDNTLAMGAMSFNGVPAGAFSSEGPYTKAVQAAGADARASLAKSDQDTICAIGGMLFGPAGTNVKNLLVKSD